MVVISVLAIVRRILQFATRSRVTYICKRLSVHSFGAGLAPAPTESPLLRAVCSFPEFKFNQWL